MYFEEISMTRTLEYRNPRAMPYRNRLARPGNNILVNLDDTTHLIPGCVNEDGTVKPGTYRSVKMTITNACNLECRHCGRDKDKPPVTITTKRFSEVADQIQRLGIEKFGLFFDGNSTLAPKQLVNCVRYLKHIGMPYVFLTDNGTSATPRNVEALIHAGIDSIKWSMNAHFGNYEELTGCNPKVLWNVIRNIRDAHAIRERVFAATGHDCSLSASSIYFNDDYPNTMHPFLREHVYPYVDTHYWLDEYSMGGEDAVTQMEGIGVPIRGNSGRHGEVRSAMPCWAPINALHIAFGPDFDGERGSLYLYSCCFPTAQEGHVMADLSKVPLEEAINSPRFRALRLAHVRNDPKGTPCEGCVTGQFKESVTA